MVEDGGVASARVIGAVRGHCADLFALGDLVKQLWQDRTVAVAAGGEFHGADVRRGRVHGQMYLAPLAASLNTVLAGLPFTIAQELDASAVNQQVQWAVGAPIRDLDGQCLLPTAQGG